MTVQDVIDAVSNDFRQVLSNLSPDANIFVSWVDRVHKDCLHTGIYNNLLQQVVTLSVVQNVSSYTIPTTLGAIRRIQLVYDRTFDRALLPIEAIGFPTNKGDSDSETQPLQIPKQLLTATTMEQWPEYYKREGADKLVIFPAPQKAAFNGTYEVHYEMQVTDLSALTDTLLLPDDAIDMVVAGVNTYTAQYLHLDQESQFWKMEYETLKKGVPIR